MIIDKPTLVIHKTSNLEYKLTPKGNDSYYLTPNDGMVPSGQMIYRTPEELDEMFIVKS